MAANPGKKSKRIKARNPVAPAVRRLRPKVEPSERTYKRKPKHKPAGAKDDTES